MSESPKPEKPALSEWLHEVVSAEAEATTEPLIFESEPKPSCHPHRFVISGKTRTVSCSKCPAEFAAYDALDYIARNWEEYQINLSALSADRTRLQESVLRLRKEVQRLKAMEKRLLTDAMLVSGHIADWLEGVVAKSGAVEQEKRIARGFALLIRAGDWRGNGKGVP